jgi:hypothetical protein
MGCGSSSKKSGTPAQSNLAGELVVLLLHDEVGKGELRLSPKRLAEP